HSGVAILRPAHALVTGTQQRLIGTITPEAFFFAQSPPTNISAQRQLQRNKNSAGIARLQLGKDTGLVFPIEGGFFNPPVPPPAAVRIAIGFATRNTSLLACFPPSPRHKIYSGS